FFFQAEDGIRDRSVSRGLGDVYKRQIEFFQAEDGIRDRSVSRGLGDVYKRQENTYEGVGAIEAVSYTHLRAHETLSDLVCRLLLEKNIMNAEEDAE
ncbi:hypothetical protein, partial [Staphylococcus aureus]